MNWADILILAVLLGFAVFIIIRMVKRRKKGGGGCGGCSGCAGCPMHGHCEEEKKDK